MEDLFIDYLIEKGHKMFDENNVPGNAYNYTKRIKNIIKWENYSGWCDVVKNIDKLCDEYSQNGSKAELGAISHDSVINALRCFKNFVDDDFGTRN